MVRPDAEKVKAPPFKPPGRRLFQMLLATRHFNSHHQPPPVLFRRDGYATR